MAMEIRGSSGAIWVEVLEPYSDEDPAPGEVQLRVDVSSCGFIGRMLPCVEVGTLHAFVALLELMNQAEAAILPGITADFRLQVAWVERSGRSRLAATGQITNYADVGTDGGPHANVLHFGLDFPINSLAAVVAGAHAMLERPG
jgi:hypothetical protein